MVEPHVDGNVRTKEEEDEDKYAYRLRRAKAKLYPRRPDERWRIRQRNDDAQLLPAIAKSVLANVCRVDSASMSADEFSTKFETERLPALISGLADAWPARERWHIERLLADYGDEGFKVGDDDDGYAIYLKMRYFLRYLEENEDDSPLYIFDSAFSERSATKKLLRDYSMPSRGYFADDLLCLGGESRRPPHRWFLVGPPRSGSYIHIDPLGTSAWNALLRGRKCWCLFPPHVKKDVVQPTGRGGREAIEWFAQVYPQLRDDASLRCISFIQEAGETVFVPSGWWHVVLNLEVTVAVTHNYCSRVNFDTVWLHVRKSRPKFAAKLQKRLEEQEPDLYSRTLELGEASEAEIRLLAGDNSSSSSSSSSSGSTSCSSSSASSPVQSPSAKRKRDEAPQAEDHGGWRDAARQRL